jgi:hypothetical protein
MALAATTSDLKVGDGIWHVGWDTYTLFALTGQRRT